MVRRGIVIDDFEEIMREPELQGHPEIPEPREETEAENEGSVVLQKNQK